MVGNFKLRPLHIEWEVNALSCGSHTRSARNMPFSLYPSGFSYCPLSKIFLLSAWLLFKIRIKLSLQIGFLLSSFPVCLSHLPSPTSFLHFSSSLSFYHFILKKWHTLLPPHIDNYTIYLALRHHQHSINTHLPDIKLNFGPGCRYSQMYWTRSLWDL